MDFDIRFFASLFNVTGIGIVLVVSLLIGRTYPIGFFTSWQYAYLGNFCLICLELLSPALGRPAAVTIAESAIIGSSAWLFTQTGVLLSGRKLPSWSYWLTTAGCAMVTGILLVTGRVFSDAVMASLVLLTVSYFLLGGWLVVRSVKNPHERHLSFGWLVIVNGLLPLTFPVLERTAYFWVGYWSAGVTHLLVGIGMIVSLLETTKQVIQQKNEELQQLDRLKNEFLSTVTHELRTPLTAIKGATWVLEQGELSEQQTMMVQMVAGQTNRLGRLISDVLDYAKLESKIMPYQLEAGDLGPTLQQAVAGYPQVFASSGIGWRMEIAPDPLLTRFDADKLTQVVVNLLSNALKFTPAGGQVTFRAGRDGESIRLEVKDTGCGIPAEELERIFSRFYQVNGSNSRPAEGSGLGLAICRSIVEEGHDGRIWAESRVGEGSAFIVTLPALPIGAMEPQSPEEAAAT